MKTQGEIEAAVCKRVDCGGAAISRLASGRKGKRSVETVRIHLIETARPIMEAMINDVTGVEVVSLHHDISTVTGEEVVLFTLTQSPALSLAMDPTVVRDSCN